MAHLIKCPTCGKEISNESPMCPYCGQYNDEYVKKQLKKQLKKSLLTRFAIGLTIVIVGVGILLYLYYPIFSAEKRTIRYKITNGKTYIESTNTTESPSVDSVTAATAINAE